LKSKTEIEAENKIKYFMDTFYPDKETFTRSETIKIMFTVWKGSFDGAFRLIKELIKKER